MLIVLIAGTSYAQKELLERLCDFSWTLVFLETPHRLLDSLEDLNAVLGNREMAVARELTKIHEDIFRGTIQETLVYYQGKAPKGEITLIVSGNTEGITWSKEKLLSVIQEKLGKGEKNPSQIAKNLSLESGWSRRDIYDLMQGL